MTLYNQDNIINRVKELETLVESMADSLCRTEGQLLQYQDKVDKLVGVVKDMEQRVRRNDELNTWMYFRGHNYPYWSSEGPIHKKKEDRLKASLDGRGADTYYKKFDTSKEQALNVQLKIEDFKRDK